MPKTNRPNSQLTAYGGRCLTTPFHIKDDYCRSPPSSRLGTGTVGAQSSANSRRVKRLITGFRAQLSALRRKRAQ